MLDFWGAKLAIRFHPDFEENQKISRKIKQNPQRFAGVAPVSRYTPLKILVSHLPPPPRAGRCRTEIWV